MYSLNPLVPPGAPLVEMLAVFGRPRRDDDRLPQALIDDVTRWDATRPRLPEQPPHLPLAYRLPLPGRSRRQQRLHAMWSGLRESLEQRDRARGTPTVTDSRRLAGSSGANGFRLFGVPRPSGEVILLLASGDRPRDGTEIWSLVADGFAWHTSWERRGDETSLTCYGLVSNDVTAVEVTIGGRPEPTTIGENGFVIETTTVGSALFAVSSWTAGAGVSPEHSDSRARPCESRRP
jgi:hypothetical protein